MKQFRCADIVPGCSAEVRARRADEVVAVATGHLASVHGFTPDDDLRARVRAGVSTTGFLSSLLART